MTTYLHALIARTLAIPLVANAVIKLAKLRPYAHIYNDDAQTDLYMGRWHLIKERRWLPIAARVHLIARPDSERDLHDHPAPFRTFILMGGYKEVDLLGQAHIRRRGDTVAHSAEYFHRITKVLPNTYTLFVYNNWTPRNPWGFLRGDMFGVSKVPCHKYLAAKRAEQRAMREHSDFTE